MFNDPFYHQTTSRVIRAFGTIFNNINIVREDENGLPVNRLKVPITYHAKKAWHRVLKEQSDRDEQLVAIQGYFPRMSYFIADVSPNRGEKQLPPKQINIIDPQTGQKQIYRSPVPYSITFELGIYTKQQEDMYRITEQIFPFFGPSLAVSIKPSKIFGANYTEDFILTLTDCSQDEELEIDFAGYNLQIYSKSLTLTTKINYFGPLVGDSSGVIKHAETTFIDGNSGTGMSKVIVEVDPPDAQFASFGISSGAEDIDGQFITYAFGEDIKCW